MDIPPKYAKSPEATQPGRTTGCSAFVRTLVVGEPQECPQKWEDGVHSAALRMGMKVTVRRLGRKDVITVWRLE